MMRNLPRYSIGCHDMGVDCDFEIKSASSEQELFELVKIHARMDHNMQSIPPDRVEAAKKAMKVQ